MLSGNAAFEDYDHPCYDPFWEACVDLELPVSFHILTTRGDIGDGQRQQRDEPKQRHGEPTVQYSTVTG